MVKFSLTLIDAEHFGLALRSLDSDTFSATLDQIRAFPERKYLKDHKLWSIPATPANLEYLRSTWTEDEYDVDPEAELVIKYQRLTDRQGAKRATRRWDYLFNDAVPDLPYVHKTTPYKHQTVALDAVHDTEMFGLLMEMGTGKTKVVVDECSWQAHTRMGDPPYKVLIVCPKTIMNNWVQEFAKHSTISYELRKMRAGSKLLDNVLELVRAQTPLKIFLTCYDRLHTQLEVLSKLNFDLAVLDESTRIKNPNARRSKAAHALRDFCRRRVIMSGAPVLNTVCDLWSQFEFLGPGLLGYSTYPAFRNRYATLRKIGNIVKITGSRRVDELKEHMAKYSFVVTKDRCLDLPPKTYITREVEMSAEQRAAYDQMLELCIASLDGREVVAKSLVTQLLRLAQICSGYLPEGGPDLSYAKIEELLELDTYPVIIWARFRRDIERISSALRKEGKRVGELHGGIKEEQRTQYIDDFNNGSLDAIVGEPGTGGLGITLLGHPDNPCHTVVYYSNDFSLEKRIQSEDRCHRIGQTRPVTYVDLCCEDSVDYRIAQALQQKRDLSDAVKDMKSIRELLLGGAA